MSAVNISFSMYILTVHPVYTHHCTQYRLDFQVLGCKVREMCSDFHTKKAFACLQNYSENQVNIPFLICSLSILPELQLLCVGTLQIQSIYTIFVKKMGARGQKVSARSPEGPDERGFSTEAGV